MNQHSSHRVGGGAGGERVFIGELKSGAARSSLRWAQEEKQKEKQTWESSRALYSMFLMASSTP